MDFIKRCEEFFSSVLSIICSSILFISESIFIYRCAHAMWLCLCLYLCTASHRQPKWHTKECDGNLLDLSMNCWLLCFISGGTINKQHVDEFLLDFDSNKFKVYFIPTFTWIRPFLHLWWIMRLVFGTFSSFVKFKLLIADDFFCLYFWWVHVTTSFLLYASESNELNYEESICISSNACKQANE